MNALHIGKGQAMKQLSTAELRKNISDCLNHVAYGKDRIRVMRRDKILAAIVPAEEVEILDRLDEPEYAVLREALLARGKIPWENLKKEQARRRRRKGANHGTISRSIVG